MTKRQTYPEALAKDRDLYLRQRNKAVGLLRELTDLLVPTPSAQARLSQGVQSAIIRARELLEKVDAEGVQL